MQHVRYAVFDDEDAPALPHGSFSNAVLGAESSSTGSTPPPSAASKPQPGMTFVDPEHLDKVRAAGKTVMRIPQMPVRLIPHLASESADAGEPWGISAVRADSSERAGEGVCVAVLDTGIDREHQAFEGLIRHDNYCDFTGTGLQDSVGHGTHCAGIIFGRTVGSRRIAVAPGVTEVLIAKIADRGFVTTTDQLEKALTWAVQQGADVISMSIGLDFLGHAKALRDAGLPSDAALVAALNDYRDYTRYFDKLMGLVVSAGRASRSALVIAAAGNDSHAEDDPAYRVGATVPATADNVISVGAIGKTVDGRFSVAPFSNSGVKLCAPGVAILSALPGNKYGTMSGTSQAAPHAAGVAALWWQKIRMERRERPDPNQVAARMTGAAKRDRLPIDARYEEIGDGLVEVPP